MSSLLHVRSATRMCVCVGVCVCTIITTYSGIICEYTVTYIHCIHTLTNIVFRIHEGSPSFSINQDAEKREREREGRSKRVT